jgi:hypothetical protein
LLQAGGVGARVDVLGEVVHYLHLERGLGGELVAIISGNPEGRQTRRGLGSAGGKRKLTEPRRRESAFVGRFPRARRQGGFNP